MSSRGVCLRSFSIWRHFACQYREMPWSNKIITLRVFGLCSNLNQPNQLNQRAWTHPVYNIACEGRVNSVLYMYRPSDYCLFDDPHGLILSYFSFLISILLMLASHLYPSAFSLIFRFLTGAYHLTGIDWAIDIYCTGVVRTFMTSLSIQIHSGGLLLQYLQAIDNSLVYVSVLYT